MPKPIARRALSVLVLAAIAPMGVLHSADSIQEQMEARHDHYHDLGDAFKAVRDLSREDSPDWASLQKAVHVIHQASIDQHKWFAPGTGPESGFKTRAKAEIWSQPEKFSAAQKMFADRAPGLLAAANAKDVEKLRAQFGQVGQSCKNCHDTFRAPEH